MESYYNSNRSIRDKNTSMGGKFNPADYQVYGLTEKEVLDLKDVFDPFDLDNTGYISPIELRAALKKFGNLNAHKNTIYHLISDFDDDMMGELSFKDFIKIASSLTMVPDHSWLIRQRGSAGSVQ